MRKYEVAHLTPSGTINEFSRIGPAMPAFEAAFAAFARGTLIQTAAGPVAVEDLLPGDLMKTGDDTFEPLVWRGSTTLVPGVAEQDHRMGGLTRIAPDTFGLGRPMPDLLLGTRARLLHRAAPIRRMTGQDSALIPARDFVDGVNFIAVTPGSPVQVYHLALSREAMLLANGVPVASFHPGPPRDLGLQRDLLGLYLSLFPHVTQLEDFGSMAHPRIRLRDLEIFDAA